MIFESWFCSRRFSSLVPASKSELQAKLDGPGPMGIERVQEGRSSNAVRSTTCLKSGRVERTGVTAHDIVPAAARIVWVIETKLGVVENIEKLGAELHLSGF